MRTMFRCGLAVFMVAAFAGLMLTRAEEDKPKYAIKDVMKEAMKGGLCAKCASGKASKEEQEKLVELFTALSQNKPPKGDADGWKAKTTALVTAAKEVAKGDKDAGKKLKEAANCKACHDAHK